MPNTVRHFYAYVCKESTDIPFYDRTFGAERDADDWIAKDPDHRFVMVDMVPFESWY